MGAIPSPNRGGILKPGVQTPGRTTNDATSTPNSEPRRGDITHLAAGSDVAPMGLDDKGESNATIPFPAFAPSPGVCTSPGVHTPGFRISPFQGSDIPCSSGGDGTPVTKRIVKLFMAAVAGEVIKGFHVAHEACRILRDSFGLRAGRHIRSAGADR